MQIADYVKIPYRFNGRDFDGVDCWGLVTLWFRHELGIELLDYKHDKKNSLEVSNSGVFAENAHKEFRPISDDQIQRHDAILMQNASYTPNHIGVYLGGGKFLHSLDEYGTTVSKLSVWRSRICGFYRHLRLP